MTLVLRSRVRSPGFALVAILTRPADAEPGPAWLVAANLAVRAARATRINPVGALKAE